VTYDVIVVGVGGMGSAACYHLATRGARVLGLEQYELGHALGSSHGDTRLIRQAYFEDERYVPLVKRAYELWDALSRAAGQRLIHRAGLLVMGPVAGGITLPRLIASAEKHGISIESIEPGELQRRYPQFRPLEGYGGVLEPGAGYLEVENCVLAHAKVARQFGAIIRENELVSGWKATPAGITVETAAGVFRASKLVVTAGAWTGKVLETIGLPLTVLRVPQFWFEAPETFSSARGSPAWAFDMPEGFIYGFPRLEGLVKVADYHPPVETVADPARVDRGIRLTDSEKILRVLTGCVPTMGRVPVRASVCMYTMTPDQNFIVDLHPDHPNVAFAAGFSGHGFKFASVIGECLADLTTTGLTALPIDFLRRRY
jgi:monomeric sarcosine oxidase